MAQADATQQKISKKRVLTGHIVSTKMHDTAVVAVTNHVPHPKYGKYLKQRKKYKAHDPGNQHAVGDIVSIEECVPVSKHKKFRIIDSQQEA
jgi:small subunit ribosomal protein S17